MKTIILISFILGFIAGWCNDKARQTYYGGLNFIETAIPTLAIIFVIYSFFQSINFGFMSILQILLGSYIGVNSYRFFKNIFKK